ncbi:unnamed protein product [Somion occarium]|uniref:EthD domain-containing protein n=1 Tax=Somion occarium TaxID=3059160 RepID=A0ABP1CHR1_9APHY
MAPPALLLVFSDPGDKVSESEFQDWYDSEHVPLRIDIPAFKSWKRLKAFNDQTPPWAAIYDLTSFEDTQNPPYTTLAETRSEREKDILSKLKLLDRRIYELYQGAPIHPPSPSFHEKTSAPYVAFILVDVKPEAEEEYNRFYDEEHIPLLSKIPGWLRSRRFVLKDWARTGTGVQKGEKAPPKYLLVSEYAHFDGQHSEEFKQAMNTPWREKITKELEVFERRFYTHYKSWERE